MLNTDGCSTRNATFVLFPFARCQHYHARTPYDTIIVVHWPRLACGTVWRPMSLRIAIAVDIQETAEDRTVCSKLSIAPASSDTLFL